MPLAFQTASMEASEVSCSGTPSARMNAAGHERATADEALGAAPYRYRRVPDWPEVPEGWSFKEVAAVGVDHADRVYVFTRGEHPMMVFDRDGRFIRAWGEGQYTRPHGIFMAPDDTLFLTDDGGHFVRQVDDRGRMLLQIGTRDSPSPYMSGEPFHRCTHTAMSPAGDIYVSDGYGNARVHKYSPDGRLLKSWGEPGTAPGQFAIVHNVCCDADGWVYVADRENHRIQIFDGDGRYEAQWNNLHRPCAMVMTPGTCPICYVGELGPVMSVNIDQPNLGPRVSVLDHEGRLLARFGDLMTGARNNYFLAPHGIAVDSRGDLYVGEVAWTQWPQVHGDRPRPPGLRTLHKFERIA